MIVLKNVVLSHFKNILDSGPVAIQPDVTCLVGKNESGKTAFLQALHRLNPAQQNVSFNAQRQYPAWLEKQHRRQKNLDEAVPVKAEFELDDSTWAELEDKFGRTTLANRDISASRRYDNTLLLDFGLNEASAVAHMARDVNFSAIGGMPTTLSAYDTLVETLSKSVYEDEEITKTDRENAAKLTAAKTRFLGDSRNVHDAIKKFLEERIPLFSTSTNTVSFLVR